MGFTCVGWGSFHQGDSRFSNISRNSQCVANSTTALAWKVLGRQFSTLDIDEILLTGDRFYNESRQVNQNSERYLFPEELIRQLRIRGQTLFIDDIAWVISGVFPLRECNRATAVDNLSDILENVLAENTPRGGFLFCGQSVTVSFWRFEDHLYLFDSHAVNQNRHYDHVNSDHNLARLFLCDDYRSLASLLLTNSAVDGMERLFSIHEITFSIPFAGDDVQPMEIESAHSIAFAETDLQPLVEDLPPMELETPKSPSQEFPFDGLECSFTNPDSLELIPVGLLTKLSNNDIVNIKPKKTAGRPKKVKRGRPKVLNTTRDEQHLKAVKKYNTKCPESHRTSVKRYSQMNPKINQEAVKLYSQSHPEVHQDAVRRYSQLHPDVNRGSVQRYSEKNPGAVQQRVQIFRIKNPKLSELRYLPAPFARQVISNGPMAYWSGDFLNLIDPYKLKKVSLWSDDIHRCPHCQARLFEEEKERKKWCCGEGSYNVQRLSPLQAPFYSDPNFIQRARAFNDLFAFCALEISGGYRHPSGLSFFKIEGRMYHQVHSLDSPGQRFAPRAGNIQFVNRSRLYIDDGEERKNIAMGRSLNVDIVDAISNHLATCNPFIDHFRRLGNEPSVDAHLTFELTSRATHGPVLGDRQTGVEVHAVLSTEDTANEPRKLTIWKSGQRKPQSIDLFSHLMEPFQYPLLYPHGELGWEIGLRDNNNRKLSQLNYSRCLLLSEPRFSHLGRLSQSWQVEMFARYEEERLRYVKRCQVYGRPAQNTMRTGPLDELLGAQRGGEDRQVLRDINQDETVQGEGGVQAGKIYLPSTFTGGPRYMKVHYENAMGLVARLGSPTFFLTFTYSATWEENKKACPNNSGRSDPGTACRVFRIKLLELLRDLRSGAMFGKTSYIVYVIEMQMRGLPHAHIVFKIDGDGPLQASDIDSVVRADIPSEEEAGGRLRKLVLRHMIHGPCGTDHRTDFPCWDATKGHCTKFFPKPSCQTTHVDERGFVMYKRDYSNEGAIKSRNRTVTVHDGWVVPYNAALMLKYEAHINLELASTRRVIKYLFKYLMKGGSLQNVSVTPLRDQDDEVNVYATKRMIGASDACWRLFEFPISTMEPTVESLPVHLEGKQIVCFKPARLSEATENASSKLIVYFNRPRNSIFDDVTYQAFYEQYIVHTNRPKKAEFYESLDGKHFVTARQRGEKICRLLWISPNRGEQYYLRILLMSTPCRGYADLLSLGGPDCRTFQEVARKLGMVEDEDEYHHVLEEASTFMLGPRLRSFFVLLCNMGAPAALLWERFHNTLCEDHLERNPQDPEIAIKLSLIEIDRSLRRQGSCLTDHGLPYVQDDTTELGRELLNYGENHQRDIVAEWEPKLSGDQRRVFEYVRSLCLNLQNPRASKIIFLDGPGGYGKTSLIRIILSYVRSTGQVALAVASSGIAAGNMPGGTTAHSMFRLPLYLGDGTGVWNITNGSQRAELIRAAQLIVFDEAPMAHRYIFEIIDRSLRDLMNNDVPFGGKIFICSGDFRQIAPVVEKARTPEDIVCVSLRASHLWRLFKVFSLTTAHRTSSSVDYSGFLLGVGNGTIEPQSFGEGRDKQYLIPLLGVRFLTSLSDMIAEVYPVNVLRDPDSSAKRAILSTLNVNVKQINDLILNCLDGQVHELRSADSVENEDADGLDVDIQLVNQATGKGVPDHVLRLKVGSVCLIMRNLNIADGLVNGTKVIVTAISNRLITVRLPNSTQPIGIPRIVFRFAFVEGSPLQVRRRQFPLVLAYAMTGHKSQGQTIEYAGVDLRTECFTHGQLYVLLSRVRHPDNIVILVPPEKVKGGVAYAKNIVYIDLLL